MPVVDCEEETVCLLAEQEDHGAGLRQQGVSSASVASSFMQMTPSVAWQEPQHSCPITSLDTKKPLLQLKSEPSTGDSETATAQANNWFDSNASSLTPGKAEITFFSVCGKFYEKQKAGDRCEAGFEDEDEDEEQQQTTRLLQHHSDTGLDGGLDEQHHDGFGGSQHSDSMQRKSSIQLLEGILCDAAEQTKCGADSDGSSLDASRTTTMAEAACSAEEPFFSATSGMKSNTCRSLVVDVHLPPAEENLLRPCKHELNRFQRCYSDGSQSSPKRKGAMESGLLQSSAVSSSTSSSASSTMSSSCKQSNDSYHNIDKIETISEMDSNFFKQKKDSNRFRHSAESSGFGSFLRYDLSSIGYPHRGFNFHDEFVHFRQSLFEGRSFFGASDSASKRKSDSDVMGSASPAPLVKYEDHKVQEDGHDDNEDEDGEGDEDDEWYSKTKESNYKGPATRPVRSCSGTLATKDRCYSSAGCATSDEARKVSPYTFFTMESDDDFDFNVEDDFSTGYKNPDSYSYMADDGEARFADHKSTLSVSSSTASLPVCRICQLPSIEPNNQLISPCRCLGSIRYVHNNCLLKWLEVSSKRRTGPPCCELCQYEYLRHKKFVISHWRFPECSFKDKILHLFFVISVSLMISCAAVTILCFKEERAPYHTSKYAHPGELSPPEMITLSCGILFFLSFFLAMYVEVKAKNTVYQLICKFFYMNHEWSVQEYDRKRDLVLTKRKKEKEEKKQRQRKQRSGSSRRPALMNRSSSTSPHPAV